MPDPNHKNIIPISDVLKSVFEKIESKDLLSRDQIEEAWKSIVGERAASHSRPSTIRNGVLTVQIESSVWMQELDFQKRSILKGLKKRFGKDRISEIRFKIGEF